MTFDPLTLPPFEIPALIHQCRIGNYDVKVLPGGGLQKNGDRQSGVRVDIRWISEKTGQVEGFEVIYVVHWYEDTFSISRYGFKGDLWFDPWPQTDEAYSEYYAAWTATDAESLVQSQAREICRYRVLQSLEDWRLAHTAYHLPRQQEWIEDSWLWADRAMMCFLRQFPDEDHPFPVQIPELEAIAPSQRF